jgi:hypothetical protein
VHIYLLSILYLMGDKVTRLATECRQAELGGGVGWLGYGKTLIAQHTLDTGSYSYNINIAGLLTY